MRLYRLKIDDSLHDWDLTVEAVVYADSEDQARRMVYGYTKGEYHPRDIDNLSWNERYKKGPYWWLDPTMSHVTEVKEEHGVVLAHFHAG